MCKNLNAPNLNNQIQTVENLNCWSKRRMLIKLNETFDKEEMQDIYYFHTMGKYDDYKYRFNLDHKNVLKSSKYPQPNPRSSL